MAKYDHDEYYTIAALEERGWTKDAIEQLLGRADKLVPYTRTPKRPPQRYYSIERVQAVERSARWRQWRDRAVEQKTQRY